MKLSTVVHKVIDLGHAIADWCEEELPKRHPNYPIINEGEEPSPPPPQQKTLRELLESLPEDMVWKIALIRNIGQRGIDPRGLQRQYEEVRERYDDAAEAIALMSGHPALGDDVEDGLAELKKHKIDVDKWNFKAGKARR
jgi:hypothetical protein